MEPRTMSDIIDLCVFLLLLVWFFLDRYEISFTKDDNKSKEEKTS
jgi:hypothetical protein